MRAFSAMLLAAAAMLVTGCGAQVNLFGHTVSEGRSKEKQPPESGEGPGRSGENTQTSAAGAGAEARPLFRDVLLSLNATVRKQAATDHHLVRNGAERHARDLLRVGRRAPGRGARRGKAHDRDGVEGEAAMHGPILRGPRAPRDRRGAG